MLKTIHICLSVIDNLGDIGFACELIRWFHEIYPQEYNFIVWTDDLEKTKIFLEKNRDDIGSFDIFDASDFWMLSWEILFLLFHHPLLENVPERDILILRIDYLSFDPSWVAHHGSEHIESKPRRQIIEIIPSPLPSGGGLISSTQSFVDRGILGKRYGLDPQKKWVSIFVYSGTLQNRLDLDSLIDTEILIFWHPNRDIPWVKLMPFLSLIEFSSCIRESAWAIVRGEVSLASTLQIGTPLMWDMYQEIGGFHSTQSIEFLEWIWVDSTYRDLFERVNGRQEWIVKFSELDMYFARHMWEKKSTEKNLIEEMQKYIDSFYISL